jgi:hypothetical protein
MANHIGKIQRGECDVAGYGGRLKTACDRHRPKRSGH